MHTDGASSVSVLIPSQSFPIYIKNFWGGGGGGVLVDLKKILFTRSKLKLGNREFLPIFNFVPASAFSLTVKKRNKHVISQLPFASVSNQYSCETIHMKMCPAYRFIFIHIKLVFI